MTDKIMKAAARLGSQRHLTAIRDGFVALMPLLIIGSLVTLVNQLPAIVNSLFGTAWAWPDWLSTLNGNTWWGTFDMIGLMAVFAISYALARHYDADRLAAALVAAASFLAIVPQTVAVYTETGEEAAAWGNVNRVYTNAQGLFVGILVALLATELFVRFARSQRLRINMPDGVPPAVGRSFSALIPGALTILLIALFALLVERLSGMDLFALITRFVSLPLLGAADTLGYALIVVFFTHFLWFFGVHGPNILEGIIQPISLQMMEQNAAAFQAGEPIPYIVTKPFLDAFVYMGGAGTVLGLLIAIFLVGRAKQHRTIAKLSIAPACFNINEPVLFGLPIVLNPILFVPFLLAPLALTLVSYFSLALGLVPRVVAIIPWSTPPLLSGLLATGGAWQAVVLQLVNLALSILIYLPFVKIADRAELRRELEQE